MKQTGTKWADRHYQIAEESDKKLQKIYHDYKAGSLLTSELKQILIDKVNNFLKHHQKQREKAKKQGNNLRVPKFSS